MKTRYMVLFWLILSMSVSARVSATSFDNMYVIGDSLSDQGNLFAATQAVSGTGIPASDHYFDGRFSNGENYIGHLADQLGVQITPSISGGTNFAYGGTRADYNRLEDDATKPFPTGHGGTAPEDLFPWTLNTQRQAFSERGINDPNGLYIVYSGSNDLSDLIVPTLLGALDPAPFIGNAVVAIQGVVQAFIAAGAETIVAPNIVDLGQVPLVVDQNPPGTTFVSDTATALALAYNQALKTMLDAFVDVNIIQFDTFALFNDITSNPTAFGLNNVDTACYSGFVVPDDGTQTVCDTPETYAFWDGEHPTTVFHAILADRMSAAVVPEPSSLVLLLPGLLLLMGASKRRVVGS